jgi:hypothetical protein
MGGVDTNLAATALAVSLVAFFIALGQLVQQYFATADGYRRCQRSVMGEWARMTRLRWRWREFRFETLYTTPTISLFSRSWVADDRRVVLDTASEKDPSLIAPDKLLLSLTKSNERVCWLSLLGSIHSATDLLNLRDAVDVGRCMTPSVYLQESSWDFQFPDVVRPLATTSVATVAIIARRLGMRWKEFDPVHGIMRAEGNAQIITSTSVRSLGTVIQYVDTRRMHWNTGERYIPVWEADSLGFGVLVCLQGYIRIGNMNEVFAVGTRQKVLATIRALEPSGYCAGVLQSLYKEDSNYHLRMADLVAMLMDMIHLNHTILGQVPAPSENRLGFTQSSQGRSAFRRHLVEYSNNHEVGEQTARVLQACEQLSTHFMEWDRVEELMYRHCTEQDTVQYKDALHDRFLETTNWAKNLGLFPDIQKAVLSVHIRYGIFRENGETGVEASLSPRFDLEIEGYFKAWPDMMEALLDVHMMEPQLLNVYPEGWSSEIVEKFCFDIWITMLFRACCWGACHEFVPGERVPSEWWTSEIPIYIG